MRRISLPLIILLVCAATPMYGAEPIMDALEELREIEKETQKRHIRVLENEFIKAKHSTRGKIGLVLADLFAKKSPRLSAVYLNSARNRISSKTWAARSRLVAATVALKRHHYPVVLDELDESTLSLLEGNLKDTGHRVRLEALYELKQYRQFVSNYESYFGKFRTAKIDESLRKKLSLSFRNLGWWGKYRDSLESLAVNYPLTHRSIWAFNKLIDSSCGNDRSGGKVNIRAKFLERLSRNDALSSGKQEAILALAETPLEDSKGVVRTLTGVDKLEFLVRARLYDAAEVLVRDLLRVPNYNRRQREKVLVLSGKVFEIQAQYSDAMIVYGTYLREFRAKRKAIDITMNVGHILANLGHYSAASELFKELSFKSRRRSIKWLYFWSAYRSNNYPLAISLLERRGYLTPMDSAFKGAKIYWHARMLEKMGQADTAELKYIELVRKYPSSYYTSIAMARNPGLKEEAVSKGLLANLSASVDISIADDGEISFEGENYGHDSKLEKSMSIASVIDGFVTGRNILFDSDFIPSREENVFWLAGSGKALQNISEASINEGLQSDYPLPFYDYIANFAQLSEIDILMVYSLMRAESRFDPDAASHVGAMGLMQIMPYTGSKIARLVGDESFVADKLKVPVTNIAYGTHYLGLLKGMFGGNSFLAAAAYNAGPDAVIKWLNRCQDCEFDELVETISYRETRRYVKKIVENLGYYSRIYRGDHPLEAMPSLPSDLPTKGELF